MSAHDSFTVNRTNLGGHRIATWNDFFRPENRNGLRLARRVAPPLMISRPEGAIYKVADIGCSQGKDTFSTAAAFVLHGVKAHITAMDVNPEVLAKADQPYRVTRQELEEKVKRWKLPLTALDLFEQVDADHAYPVPQLRSTVTFRQADIRSQALEPGYDAAIANNVLSYYTERPKRHLGQIVGNIVSGLGPESVMTVGTYFPTFEPEFGDHGLVAAERFCDDPSAPTFFALRPGA
jgi:chemotaxis protein methyltransferase CheR